MEDQIPASRAPEAQMPIPGSITPEQLEEMKARARELALQQTIAQQATVQQQQPRVVYVRRNLTVAELLLIFLLSSGLVLGIQGAVHLVSNYLPRIEIKVK